MKNFIISIVFISSVCAYATEPQTTSTDGLPNCSDQQERQRNEEFCNRVAPLPGTQNRSQPGTSSNVSRCNSVLQLPIGAAVALSAGADAPSPMPWAELGVPFQMPTTTAAIPPLIDNLKVEEARKCRAMQRVTVLTNGGSFGATGREVAQDGKIWCQRLAGYTADYESCTSTLSMYNNVVMMEAALFVVQAVQSNQTQQNVQQQTNQRVAQGDGQNAMYDAQIANTSKASQLNQQKAMAYAAAVAALGSKIASWIKDDPESLKKVLCSNNRKNVETLGSERIAAPEDPQKYLKPSAVPAPACEDSVIKAYEAAPSEVIANKQAKGAFTTAAMMFAAKGIQAGIQAKQLGDIAKKIDEAKKQTENPYDAPTFEYCKVNTFDPKCSTPGTVTEGSGLQDGGFSFGEGFGNNAFTPTTDADTLGAVDPLGLPSDSAIPDTSNPFSDDAKTASGILDPAAAATIQPGSAGGGGGGGAPGLGGGSASLGNDTPGMDDSKKESDIKANKADGKYNIAGGGAFQAIKPMSNENPFANLFDGKGGGSLNEDRSIASEIDGQDSGLFSKISKRYGQIQADKRIEAKNLDAE